MEHSKSRREVYLVTEKSPQTQLFVNYLADNTECSIYVLSPSAELTACSSLNSLLLIDSDHTDIYTLVNKWQDKLPPELIDIPIAALNVNDISHALEILSCAKLKGVFYRKESLDVICKGINALLDRELWMSRELMAHLIIFYRKSQNNAFRPAYGLTNREMEIITLLSAGASNQQIAEKLFVSEHTVKSHIYNIFRKINVRNRIQALNWIQKNLGPIMPNIDDTKSSL